MFCRRARLLAFLFALVLVPADVPAGASPQKAVLLNVSAGQIPGDTGMDDKTKQEIVELKELGGKALKVPFAPGDSFGGNAGANRNWKRFAFLRFDVFNPSSALVALEVDVAHSRSSSYQTRVAVPVKVKPGKNQVKL